MITFLIVQTFLKKTQNCQLMHCGARQRSMAVFPESDTFCISGIEPCAAAVVDFHFIPHGDIRIIGCGK